MNDKETESYNQAYRRGMADAVFEDEKRNYLWDFAGLAMQSFLTHSQDGDFEHSVAERSVHYAKSLIKQLEAE